ncbi:hypothetical protein DPMN_058448 [Dreissena polymorpha]|uniref:Uncharacterized protein n=1 Tax=Dreissena polymorpha TaxID=45954 RepID=A0A9D4C1R8_DREPO|nr:hypothetical protein DPMN_058448 [Dreissena polymorpha]
MIRTNVLTKFHLEINSPPHGSHIFQHTGAIFNLIQDIIITNVLTNKNARPLFYDDWTINVASGVLTRLYLSNFRKNAPPPWGNFHEDWTINVTSRVRNAPLTGGDVFQPTGTIFKLVQDIIGINLLTKFHEDWTINVAAGLDWTKSKGSNNKLEMISIPAK